MQGFGKPQKLSGEKKKWCGYKEVYSILAAFFSQRPVEKFGKKLVQLYTKP